MFRPPVFLGILLSLAACSQYPQPKPLPPALVETPPDALSTSVPFVAPLVGTKFFTSVGPFLVAKADAGNVTIEDRWGRHIGWTAGLFSYAAPKDPQAAAAIWPLSVGRTVVFDEQAGSVLRRHTVNVVREEAIDTQAGTFRALVLEDHIRPADPAATGTMATVASWYAPAVHAVVKRDVLQLAGPPLPVSAFSLTGMLLPNQVAARMSGRACAPTYPLDAARKGITGTSIVRTRIDENGRVVALKLLESSGDSSLDQSFVASLRDCLFLPSTIDGKPTNWTGNESTQFKLQNPNFTDSLGLIELKLDQRKEIWPYVARSDARLQQGDTAGAVADLDAVIAQYPNWSLGLYLRGKALRLNGEFPRALADLNHAIEVHPFFETYDQRGIVYSELGQYDLARKDFEQAIKLEPFWDYPYSELAMDDYFSSRYEDAERELKYAILLNPQSSQYITLLDLVEARLGHDNLGEYGKRMNKISQPRDWVVAIGGVYTRELTQAEAFERAKDEEEKIPRVCENVVFPRRARPAGRGNGRRGCVASPGQQGLPAV